MSDLLDRLRTWADPAVAYRSRILLVDDDPDSPVMTALADQVRESPDCNAVIEGCFPVARHPYRKWQGPHWALTQLAERGGP